MKKIIVAFGSMIIGVILGGTIVYIKKEYRINKKVDKFKKYYTMLNEWLVLKHNGKSIEEYFIRNNYKTIIIYGMGEIGNRLYEELVETGVNIKYVIDKNSDKVYANVETVATLDNLEGVDAIIITPIADFTEIESSIKNTTNIPIISIEEVVYGV
jgi:hypothetical protein